MNIDVQNNIHKTHSMLPINLKTTTGPALVPMALQGDRGSALNDFYPKVK